MKNCIAAAVLSLAANFGYAATEVADGLSYRCDQSPAATMHCDFGLLEPAQVKAVSASIDGQALSVRRLTGFPRPGNTVAIMILVDTSDPARSEVIARNVAQVKQLIDHAKPYYRMGLARFDSDLQILMPLGSSPDTIKQAADQLAAVGRTTELYRSTLEAVRRIAEYEADRRALFIFSDGCAAVFAQIK